jgi:hypothetical protein
MKRIPTFASIAICGVALIIPAFAQATRPKLLVSKATTAITSPLLPNGLPDYARATTERFGNGVTADNNQFVALLNVLGTDNRIIDPSILDKSLQMLGMQHVPPGPDLFKMYSTEFLASKNLDKDAQAGAEDVLIGSLNQLWEE